MKRNLTLLLLFVSFICFSQAKKTLKSGYITFNSGITLEFKDMTIEDEKVKYFNPTSQSQMEFSTAAVKKIVDNTGAIIYAVKKAKMDTIQSETTTNIVLKKSDDQKLVYKSYSRILLNGQKQSKENVKTLLQPHPEVYNLYKEGRSNAILGDILIGGGIGLFVGGGISNVYMANNNIKGGGPELLIAGIITSLIGIPVKIGGTKKVKRAIDQYNALPVKPVSYFNKPELKVVAGAGGVGFHVQFQ